MDQQKTFLYHVTAGGDRPNHQSTYVTMSRDGRYVAFVSSASNIVPNGLTGQIFRHDRLTGAVTNLSVSDNGDEGNHGSYRPFLSRDGSVVVFDSLAGNLVPGDSGFFSEDIFVRACSPGAASAHCVAYETSEGCKPRLSSRGVPSLANASSFDLEVEHFPPDSTCAVLMGLGGPSLDRVRFDQLLCLAGPIQSLGWQRSEGQAGVPCTGGLALDFNAFMAANSSYAPAAGSVVFLQAWCHDQAAPGGAALSDALAFVMGP
jgi:hypothetical protein